MTAAATATFYPFPHLPAELRSRIWELIVEPRVVDVRVVHHQPNLLSAADGSQQPGSRTVVDWTVKRPSASATPPALVHPGPGPTANLPRGPRPPEYVPGYQIPVRKGLFRNHHDAPRRFRPRARGRPAAGPLRVVQLRWRHGLHRGHEPGRLPGRGPARFAGCGSGEPSRMNGIRNAYSVTEDMDLPCGPENVYFIDPEEMGGTMMNSVDLDAMYIKECEELCGPEED
ncbi:hypothetical protein CSUB01_06743 [Colletotrichum sublineola]|uniref:2EXR domain-containing protein n=1 Tax=Colletotrichum sublineola TaxID=1173701 RepID=A0A066XCD4_COLSU|nr:hypothetical protein CSUB01_06743 [Colletotrichum sublineola]